jgi:signal recognition particle subunit SEC65
VPPLRLKTQKKPHHLQQKNLTLKQTLHIISHAYKCTNQKNCKNPKEIYKSQEPEKICLKHYQYSIKIITKIGHLYYNKHQTIQQIKQTLKNHVSISSIHGLWGNFFLTILIVNLVINEISLSVL